MLVRPVVKRVFFPWKTKEKKARFARTPHYYAQTSSLASSEFDVSWAVGTLYMNVQTVRTAVGLPPR